MKIIIASDSHGNNKVLDEIALKHQDADIFLHAGDSEMDEYMIMPFETVLGNCDHFSNAPIRKIIDTPMGKLLLQHYPTIPEDIIEQYHIKFFVHGHTHRRENIKKKGLVILCPGSISFDRDGNDLSYMELIVSKDDYEVIFRSLLEEK